MAKLLDLMKDHKIEGRPASATVYQHKVENGKDLADYLASKGYQKDSIYGSDYTIGSDNVLYLSEQGKEKLEAEVKAEKATAATKALGEAAEIVKDLEKSDKEPGIRAKDFERLSAEQVRKLDVNKDGKVTKEDFVAIYPKGSTNIDSDYKNIQASGVILTGGEVVNEATREANAEYKEEVMQKEIAKLIEQRRTANSAVDNDANRFALNNKIEGIFKGKDPEFDMKLKQRQALENTYKDQTAQINKLETLLKQRAGYKPEDKTLLEENTRQIKGLELVDGTKAMDKQDTKIENEREQASKIQSAEEEKNKAKQKDFDALIEERATANSSVDNSPNRFGIKTKIEEMIAGEPDAALQAKFQTTYNEQTAQIEKLEGLLKKRETQAANPSLKSFLNETQTQIENLDPKLVNFEKAVDNQNKAMTKEAEAREARAAADKAAREEREATQKLELEAKETAMKTAAREKQFGELIEARKTENSALGGSNQPRIAIERMIKDEKDPALKASMEETFNKQTAQIKELAALRQANPNGINDVTDIHRIKNDLKLVAGEEILKDQKNAEVNKERAAAAQQAAADKAAAEKTVTDLASVKEVEKAMMASQTAQQQKAAEAERAAIKESERAASVDLKNALAAADKGTLTSVQKLMYVYTDNQGRPVEHYSIDQKLVGARDNQYSVAELTEMLKDPAKRALFDVTGADGRKDGKFTREDVEILYRDPTTGKADPNAVKTFMDAVEATGLLKAGDEVKPKSAGAKSTSPNTILGA